MKTLIQGGFVVAYEGDGHKLIRDGVVVYENDRIIHVGKDYPGEIDATLDAGGMKLITPGFIDAQACGGRLGGDVLGFGIDVGRKDLLGPSGWNMAPSKSYLKEIMEGPRIQDRERAAISVEFAAAQVLMSGTTTVVTVPLGMDDDSEDPTVEAIGRLGNRAYLARGYESAYRYADANGARKYHWDEEKGYEDMAKGEAFVRRYEGAYGGRIRTMLFPCRLDSCTPDLLRKSKVAARDLNVRIRIHVAQYVSEFYDILQWYSKTPVEFLSDIGFLDPNILLHHCIFIGGHSRLAYPDSDDIQILADSGVSVGYAPIIFARRGVILESFHRYIQAGVNMALATDTTPPDMMMVMRLGALTCKIFERNVNTGTARDFFNAATLGGAKALGRDDLGRLSPGAKADIAIIDLENLRVGPIADPIRSLVHFGNMDDVKTVIVDGKIVVQDGSVVGLSRDERELLALVQGSTEKLKEETAARDWAGRSCDEMFPPILSHRVRRVGNGESVR